MAPTTPVAGRRCALEENAVAVELYQSQSQARKLVLHVPEQVLRTFAPSIANYIGQDPIMKTKALQIKVKSLETAEQLEVPALRQIFQHMSTLQRYGCLHLTSLPQWITARQGVCFYSALRMLGLYPQATFTRATLLLNMKQRPLDALDVEAIWNVFGPYGDVFEGMLKNIAYYKVHDMFTDESLIMFFLENEVGQLADAERESVFERYYAYKDVARRDV